jgi:ParB family chromosome partitioning protein
MPATSRTARQVAKKRKSPRRKKATPPQRGLSPTETGEKLPDEVRSLAAEVEADGGRVLATYREPLGGHAVLFAALPVDKVQPTPYPRDLSEPHVKRLVSAMERVDRFLDPLIAVRHEGSYWTPNGNHRLAATRALGSKTVLALLLPEAEVAFQILALNTEKAHNLKEKSLETIRMLRALADAQPGRTENEFLFEFDQPAFLTLGAAYDERPRLSGGAYQPILRRIDGFLDEKLPRALKERARRARQILSIDDEVGRIVEKLKKRGLTSPYLRPFVVARINPIRFSTSTEFDFDNVVSRMQASAAKFNVDRVKQDDIVRAGGGPPDED